MSQLPSGSMHGYLLLADISGYTPFVSQTELDHAQEILADLLETILKRFKLLLAVHKIEGDAIFAYAPDARVIRGETLLELVEATYADFRERMRNVRRHITCTCKACQSIPMLDLKFIIHHGDFVVQHIGGTLELVGSDVNLVHRLLKNHVSENTGWRGYTLITAAALDRMELKPDNLVQGAESYEHLGEVATFTMDMHARYDAFLHERRAVVEEQDAFLTFSVDLPATPPEVWSWMNEPEKRDQIALYPHPVKFIPVLRPGGRTAAGATTHCVHGKNIDMRETVHDWKPFDYYTVEQDSGAMGPVQVTFRFQPSEDGSRTYMMAALKGSVAHLPAFLNRRLLRYFYTHVFNYPSVAVRLKVLLAQSGHPESTDQIPPH